MRSASISSALLAAGGAFETSSFQNIERSKYGPALPELVPPPPGASDAHAKSRGSGAKCRNQDMRDCMSKPRAVLAMRLGALTAVATWYRGAGRSARRAADARGGLRAPGLRTAAAPWP